MTQTIKKKILGLELKVFPLHPWPDEEEGSASDKRRIESEGQFTWVPTSWEPEKWGTSIVGMSGGPVVLVSNETVALTGVIARQKPAGKNPDFIGVCDVSGILGLIRTILQPPNSYAVSERPE